MSRGNVSLACIATALLFLSLPAFAHDIWINKERRSNSAGEWCCNGADCTVVPYEKLLVSPRGYTLTETGEFIPHSEAAASGDDQFWICRRPDKSRRCVFFPPGGM